MVKGPRFEIATSAGAEVAAPAATPVGLAARITVEQGLYATIFFAGGLLRFAGLGDWPLSVPEAVQAWPAWQTVQGIHHELTLLPESAALQGLLTGLFYLGANDDFWVRFVAAAAGSALIVVPWWWRDFLGRWGALWLALLLAISPWAVAISRMADGSALALLAFFVALTGLQQLARPNVTGDSLPAVRRRWSMVAAAGVGFMLTTGILAWSLGLLLILFAVIYRRGLRAAFVWDARVVAAFGLVFLIGATGGLLRPDGFGLVAGSLGVWLGRIQPGVDLAFAYSNGAYGRIWPWVRLAVDQPILLIFGLGGLSYLGIRRRRGDAKWPVVLWAWLGWAVLLCVFPQRGPRDLLVLFVPLAFGTAHAFAALCNAIPTHQDRRNAIAVFVTLAILSISFVFWTAGVAAAREFDPTPAQSGLLVLGLAVLILFVYGWWESWAEAYWLGAVTLAAWLLLFTISGAWQIAHRQDLARPDGFLAEVTHPEIRQLVKDMETISAQRSGDPHQIAIRVEDAQPAAQAGAAPDLMPVAGLHPVLGWYLRDFRNVSWGSQAVDLVASQQAPLIVTLPGSLMGRDGRSEGVPDGYWGSDYGLTATWLPANLPTSSGAPGEYPGGWAGLVARFRDAWRSELQPWLRWALYRHVEVQPDVEPVILWVGPTQ